MADSLLDDTQVYVSSVLNRNIKEYGKKYMFDGCEETCWNSDQGEWQWVLILFPTGVKITELQIQFQGGFVGKECWLEGGNTKDSLEKLSDFYPDDVNSLQKFQFCIDYPVSAARIIFKTSTDFFGRITIYKLDVIGHHVTS